MLLRFTKMHGLGNDFVVIDAVTQSVTMTPELARKLGDRHFGIGCDQLLLVEPPPSPDVDFSYRIFNADGSEVEQCGNGIRCFAKFVRDRRMTGKRSIRVSTCAGILTATVGTDNRITVDMGVPVLEPAAIPFTAPQRAVTYALDAGGQRLDISAVSMGNPHLVLEVADIDSAPVATLGPLLESHPHFPNRVNAGFMAIHSPTEIDLRVYERGAGETLACGSGACAAVVSGILRGQLHTEVQVNLPGGPLTIHWEGEGHPVMMTGPAVTVFQGRIKI